jgi:uncharacterized repeat protein (TIGR01451 family)
MRPSLRRWCLLLLVLASSGLLSGCFGVTQNPSYFPHLVPFGDIIQTHAKPPGPSYYSNYDPHAVRLEVRPVDATNPVRTQHVLVATIYDETGKPRRARRIEWMVEGVGNIVEVDESGCFAGRGYKVDNHYAVSYTNYHEHRITRGNKDPNDDFVIRPGQSWCVITSAVEGDTHVTVYAPEIADWSKHKVFVTNHWVDAEWALPPAASERSGAQHTFTTHVFRHTDRQPLAKYRVRYHILDGPPAVFLPSQTQEAVAVSDLRGDASVTIAQQRPGLGTNRIAIEIIRPPDPSTPSGSGIVIGSGETAVEWLAPDVALNITGPPTAARGQDLPYTITVTNRGRVETRSMTVRDQVPAGCTYVSSQPPAIQEGAQLTWTLGLLPPGQTHTIQLVLRAPANVGPVQNCARVQTEEGLTSENCVTTQITAPQLRVGIAGPATAVVGAPITYQVTVSNPGSGPATNVKLTAGFDLGLEHESKARSVDLPIGTLGPNESRTVPLVLTASQEGKLVNRVTATADGGLKDQAEHPVVVQKAQVSLQIKGPPRRFVGRPADWDIRIVNTGEAALTNVVLRHRLPPEMGFASATEGGQLVQGQVEWRLGTLAPRQEKTVRVTTTSNQITPAAISVAVVTADAGLIKEEKASLEILGTPAYRFQVTPSGNPVEIGKQINYVITVENTGSQAANDVEIAVVIPPELKLVKVSGPSKETIAGQNITFAKVSGVKPAQTLTYTIQVEGVKQGDVRFHAELRGETLTSPVLKEAPTTIYDPQAPIGPPPMGPAPMAPPPMGPAPLPVK